jgi:GDPmannose 4,6-dehydratase
MKTAMITGVRGQDGSYLSDLLIEKGYKVVGVERSCASVDYSNIEHLKRNPDFTLASGDITDSGSISRLVKQYRPDEFYNMAAQSFVASSWNEASSTCNINFIGVCNCLEAIRLFSPETKFLQASTSEIYGEVDTDIQNEKTPGRPLSPYAASKYGAEGLMYVYRKSHGTFACFSRAFNHESPRRGKHFVTRKITNGIAQMMSNVDKTAVDMYFGERKVENSFVSMDTMFNYAIDKGIIQPLKLGNLDACRDWSHAKDIVRGMWMMLQRETPENYVLASGKTRSIRDFLTAAFGAIDIEDWSRFVEVDPAFYRPADVHRLCGDSTKAREELGWVPEYSFEQLVHEMIEKDVALAMAT